MIAALRAGNKLLIIGNGGSAADAQHIAAEIIGRYKQDRPGYAAIALTTDTSALTAIANDYGFEQVFARQVEGLGRRGDVLLALSTSGRSPNILAALRKARELGLVTIGFTGTKGEAMGALCDHLLVAPSDDTPVVQQIHLAIGPRHLRRDRAGHDARGRERNERHRYRPLDAAARRLPRPRRRRQS